LERRIQAEAFHKTEPFHLKTAIQAFKLTASVAE
jgi:hypothetical protein